MSISNSSAGRPRRGRLYIVIGAVLAVIAFGTAALLASLPLIQGTTTGTKIVVARNGISARTLIQASDLELMAYSPVPPGASSSIAHVAGRGARVDIPAGYPVTANLTAPAGDLLSNSDVAFLPIPSGYVAVTVPAGELLGVGGYVQVGDRITMLATINSSAFGASPGAPVVRTVFRDLDVIRVGPATPGSATAAAVTSSLTLLMTSCDSEFLFWLLNNSTMKYTLESFHDSAATPAQPDPSCPKLSSAAGVGPKEVDARWHFTTP
ncbi:MAG TPA: RcpC/CpaB family pilus assembly protein [Candidatus Dormibacteraeota bacterium]|nr:RcpC/CpaB family pilus assembly protein [Candidatus Dormibacteraeota bacterium]